MKKFAAILRDIGFVFFSVFILFMIFLMSSGKHVSIAGYQVLRVLTSSMEPTISENTCIIIKKVPVENLKVGDVITFTSDDPQIQGLYNTHRIHDIVEENGETLYVTKGDAIDAVDAYPVHQNQVAGIFVRELPGGRLLGKCFVALSDNKIYFLVIILPLMICLLSYFWQIMGMFRKSEEELTEEEANEDPAEGDSGKDDSTEREESVSLENASEEEYDEDDDVFVITDEDLKRIGLSKEELEAEVRRELTERLKASGFIRETDSSDENHDSVKGEAMDESEGSYRYTDEDFQDKDYKYDFTKDKE